MLQAAVHRAQTIPESANRLDELQLGTELGAKPLHVHVDGSRLHVRRGVPHVLEQLRPALQTTTSKGECEEQFEFGSREIDCLSTDRYAVTRTIDLEWTDGDRVRAGRSAASATQDSANAKHELQRAERLREVIIRAEREAANAVRLLSAGGEHEHGNLAR